jgi:uncharacterized protein YcbK (DUF882 family)
MTGRLTEHFSRDEFACKCGCGFDGISMDLVRGLERLRDALGKPIVILSGCRCARHNMAEGGARRSQHVLGRAADIRVPGMGAGEVYAAAAGISELHGFGVDDARNFVHVDVREIGTRWCYRNGREVAWIGEAVAA